MRVDIRKQGGYVTSGLSLAGGTIGGKLVLSRHPVDATEAATKGYIDNLLSNLNANSFIQGALSPARLPAFNGDVSNSEGSNVFSLYPSGVTPGKYTKVRVNNKGLVITGTSLGVSDLPEMSWNKIISGKPNTLAGYGITDAISINDNITMSGPLTLTADPTSDNHLVTKRYIDMVVSSSSGYRTGDIIRRPSNVTPEGFYRANGGQVDKDTNSSLYSVIGDKYTDNTTPGSGQPWRLQYQINDKQSAEQLTWNTGTAFPVTTVPLKQIIVTKNRVYILGGVHNGSTSAAIYTSIINTDGTLGSWVTSSNLPVAVAAGHAIVISSKIYLIGGYNGTSRVSTIYMAPINSDGTLGTWILYGNLPIAINYFQLGLTKTKLYILGGHAESGHISNVYSADVYSDGNLGTWTLHSTLPAAIAYGEVVIIKNKLYLIGGSNGTSLINTIYMTTINSNDIIGTWSNVGTIPDVLDLFGLYVTKNRIYIFGGNNAPGGAKSTAYSAAINSDGTFGNWISNASIPGPLAHPALIATSSKMYLIGGWNATGITSAIYYANIVGGKNDYSEYYQEDTTNYMTPGSGRPWEQQYQINNSFQSDITGWTTGPVYPISAYAGTLFSTKNRVYIVGGILNGNTNSVRVNTVCTAPINTDGTLGTWTTGTNFPVQVFNVGSIVFKNYVYFFGCDSSLKSIYRAPINADGTIGTWSHYGNLPDPQTASYVFLTKNRVYVCGGFNGITAISTVYTAVINADGTLGVWTLGNPLPGVNYGFHTLITKNRVYIFGGSSLNANLSTIYSASINSDGIVGVWSTVGSLPEPAHVPQVFSTKNRVYILSHWTDAGNSLKLHTAPINPDGTIGTFTLGTQLTTAYHGSHLLVTSSRIYLIGGFVNQTTCSNIVQSAAFTGGLNDYSPYYDGTIIPIDKLDTTNYFTLPDYSAFDTFNIFHYIKY